MAGNGSLQQILIQTHRCEHNTSMDLQKIYCMYVFCEFNLFKLESICAKLYHTLHDENVNF